MANGEPSILKFFIDHPVLFIVLMAWIFFWKGLALWKAARLSHKWWFFFVLVTNTVGILEIVYIYFIAKKYVVEEKIIEEPVQ